MGVGGASVPGIGYLPNDSAAFWSGVGSVVNFLFLDDIKTLFNPNASLADKSLAAAGFIPYAKVFKGGKLIIKFYKQWERNYTYCGYYK